MNLFAKEYANLAEMFMKIEGARKEIISNSEYISWLENFTAENSFFTDDQWTYCPEKISVENKKCVEKLNLFYSAIVIYAQKNYIYPKYDELGAVLYIKYNGVGYEIGQMCGQGTITFCSRVKIEKDNENNFIEFTDVINNKKQANTDLIKKKLDGLDSIIRDLAKDDVPWQAIEETIKTAIKEINENSNN